MNVSQDKNTIKAVMATIAAVIIGEGILSWGLYWPFLFLLFDWDYVFWLGLAAGILISALNGLPVGWPSLFIVVVLGVMSVFLGVKKGLGIKLILLSVAANWIFDKIFGLPWSLWETGAIALIAVLLLSWDSRSESIKIRYK